jgi:methyl-accepting chemotaxis protein
MTNMPPKTTSMGKANPVSYVKFSDQLTGTLQDITRMINQQKETIDSIQEMGIQLTATFGTLHTMTVKYAGIVNNILDLLLPFLKKIPLVPPQLLELATQIERITQQIIDNSEKTSKTIADIDAGLKTADVNRLKGYSGELQNITQALSAILPDVKK